MYPAVFASVQMLPSMQAIKLTESGGTSGGGSGWGAVLQKLQALRPLLLPGLLRPTGRGGSAKTCTRLLGLRDIAHRP